MSNSVFDSKNQCCGCSACVNACPRNAISIEEDEYGFSYPKIDKTKCVNCKLCEKVCPYKNKLSLNSPIKCYAGTSTDDNICFNSASGGIFYTLALMCLKKSFSVYGSFMEFKESKPIIKHIKVDKEEELYKLQGSKYVQSNLSNVFSSIKNDLLEGRKVLFSGTPCQVQAIKNYLLLKKINIDNLYTIDIICHGVPSIPMFTDYINSLRNNQEVIDFKFRDKKEGWGLMASITLRCANKIKIKRVYPKTSSYYYLFLNADIYRDSCYNCKFSSNDRVGDITLGDYWGIEKLHPEYLKENGGTLDRKNGISCILINTDKGKELFNDNNKLVLETTSIENVAKYNHNLNEPSHLGNNREYVLGLYKQKHDFNDINKWYKKKNGIKYYIYNFWIKLPHCIRKVIRNLIAKLNH